MADYEDEWVPGVRAWFVCRSGTRDKSLLNVPEKVADQCWTLMPSKVWTRRWEDPTRSRQKWFCKCCRAGFHTSYKMLVCITCQHTGKMYWLVAPVADPDSQDIRDMRVERDYKVKNMTSAHDLFDSIPHRLPELGEDSIVRLARRSELADSQDPDGDNIFKVIEDKRLEATTFPEWDWLQIFNFV